MSRFGCDNCHTSPSQDDEGVNQYRCDDCGREYCKRCSGHNGSCPHCGSHNRTTVGTIEVDDDSD